MFANVLVVCHANVCRSPAAEMLFKARALPRLGARMVFQSAGIRAFDGDGMDPVMRRLLAEHGVATSGHRARRLNRRLVRDADLVLVTERAQVKEVEALDPTSRGKVWPLGKWEDSDVADPHGGHEAGYRASLVLIEHLVMGWLKKIC
ncbi:low molecular weight protein-tyrosine-phosphatase [Paraburkholderia gardini]|uniref:protein-tyrosine-phosphatase n=1 Tax=Paraburkholderia gardini TaxID=2823469 RepID=A0ABN7QIH2_9BURK|nr:low molecular weight protein-tyrosine-phosphatase [Paraburkholderia gardini]CAG4887498.1 Low molecular weight protein-tyrosine-phosphatase Wzb [Paraburkholderia gardini]CAG4898881.1 Low molecular weight protein-tyrosine-phosphatase Wzb [Paraburkholderia gardini]